MILDGNLRDIGGLRQIGFQVFYRDVSPLNAIGRWEMVASQVSVTIGGVTINPGDVVIAEFDGVVVVPADVAEQVLEAAEKIDGAEAKVRVEMQAGESPLSSLGGPVHICAGARCPLLVVQMGRVKEVVVLEWLYPNGAVVALGQPVVVIATDKAEVELEAPADGVLEIEVPAADEEIPVLTVLANVVTEWASSPVFRSTGVSPS